MNALAPSVITVHALLRWAERVMGVDLYEARRAMQVARPGKSATFSDAAVLAYLEEKRCITVERIRGEMMHPTVLAALRIGARSVRLRNVDLVISEGRVVTVLLPGQRRYNKRSTFVKGRPRK